MMSLECERWARHKNMRQRTGIGVFTLLFFCFSFGAWGGGACGVTAYSGCAGMSSLKSAIALAA